MSGIESTPNDSTTPPGTSSNKPSSSVRRSSSIASLDSQSDRRSSTSSRPRNSIDSASGRQTSRSKRTLVAPYDRQSNSGPDDRVFPVRSVVSVDPTHTPFQEHVEGAAFPGLSSVGDTTNRKPGKDGSTDDRTSGAETASENNSRVSSPVERMNSFRERSSNTSSLDPYQLFRATGSASSNSTIHNSGPNSIASTMNSSREGFPITARFKHIILNNGHAVITGRDGDTLQRCEDEPIHTPGAVQGFGLLVALEEEDEGKLVVRVVSENSQKIIGFQPHELFALSSFTDILSEEQADNLLDHIDFIRDEDADVASNGPEVFTISVRPSSHGRKRPTKLWCAMHINPSAPNKIICEFELDDDQENPLAPRDDSPELPEDTLDSAPTDEELFESTHAISKPLRVLRSARKRRGEAAAMEVFNIMSQVQEQLASATNLESFLKVLCGVVKELTGFHRVMIYQFDSSYNGRVVTELVDPHATKDLYRGLNFPASDIPKQARDLYKINKVRLLYDRDLPTARLVCRTSKDLERPLDLTFSYLRAMSPIHIKYLANMAVRSSMSISINAFDELWGLIALHGYGAQGMRVSFPIRKMCRLVGDTASRNIERLSYASRLQARKLINTAPSEANPSGYIVASSDDLLKLFDADFGVLSIHGETKILGKPEQTQELLAMVEYLRLRNFSAVLTSNSLKQDFPDAPKEYIKDIAGLLLVPLSVAGGDFIVFFRKGQLKEVKWAGNPYEKYVMAGTEGYLEPRKSFKTWTETVMGKCRDWTEEQIETAAVLCLVYGKFIEVWRIKEAALQSSQLTKLLLSNQAHEVRTPLNAIINYLEIALEGNLDHETRENLAKSHSASKSLIYVINDLLDLTKTEEGQDLVKFEVFDLPTTIREATDFFKKEATRKNLEFEVVEHPGVPRFVHGDQRRVGQVVSNITANAIQHTSTGSIRVEIWLAGWDEQRALIDIVVEDTGCGMSDATLDDLFRDLEQVSIENGDELLNQDMVDGRRALGLGLAVVSRVVQNCGGNLRVKSTQGQGSRFVCQLPFEVLDNEIGEDGDSVSPPPTSQFLMSFNSAETTPTPPATVEGEFMLVDKTSSLRHEGVIRPRVAEDHKGNPSVKSNQSLKSNQSFQSYQSGSTGGSHASHKSDIDRLIDTISEPLSVGRAQSTMPSESKGKGIGSLTGADMGNAITPASSPRPERPILSRRTPSNKNFSVPEHRRSPIEGPPGFEYVQDNKTLLSAIRMPEEFEDDSRPRPRLPGTSRVAFDLSEIKDEPEDQVRKLTANNLQVLVAEDDPINSRIILKRLGKSGHSCHHTVNGEECATAYTENPAHFDVILMDMQMPLVDGLTSTKMIRSFEKSNPKALSSRAALNTRVPIFAVSASLVERQLQTYISAGFDGWILKPIDFNRLTVLLTGIVSEDVRNSCLYKPGEWERGGWFAKRQPDVFAANTKLDGAVEEKPSPITEEPSVGQEPSKDLESSATKDFATRASSAPGEPVPEESTIQDSSETTGPSNIDDTNASKTNEDGSSGEAS